MNKEGQDKSDFYTNWYELWMKQSQDFFSSAEKNLKGMFEDQSFKNPEAHLKQINEWLETLKTQWEFSQLTDDQKAQQMYWKMMAKMCSDAADRMVSEWIKRSKTDNPIQSIRELYELWLACCQEVYQKALQTKNFQEAYADFMNAAFKFWQSAMPNTK